MALSLPLRQTVHIELNTTTSVWKLQWGDAGNPTTGTKLFWLYENVKRSFLPLLTSEAVCAHKTQVLFPSLSTTAPSREWNLNSCFFVLLSLLAFKTETIHHCIYFSQTSNTQEKKLFWKTNTETYLQQIPYQQSLVIFLQIFMKEGRNARYFRPRGMERAFIVLKENYMNSTNKEERMRQGWR